MMIYYAANGFTKGEKPVRMAIGKITPTKFIIIGYILIILTGALLLMLPISTMSSQSTPFHTAFFTATSATCVTGLVLHDTYTYWSFFGQLVILFLIQIGGLGFITLAIAAATFTRQKIGLKQRFLIQEAISAPQMGGIVRLARFAISGALLCEFIGAFFLALRLCPQLGLGKGIYFAVFHAVSAFCNAGFDLMGVLEENSSLTHFSGDSIFNFTIMGLIVLGGLGFIVWEDLQRHKLHWRKYRLQTKVVLSATAFLIFGSTLLFFLIELNGPALAGKSIGDKLIASLFQSITPRTAGFNTISLTQLQESTVLLITLLMLIGGSPGSTAGGIKTTTIVILILSVRATLRRQHALECFQRRIDDDALRKAVSLLLIYLSFFITAALLIAWLDNVTLTSAAFEAASAIGTVGLSLGITADLSVPSQLILIFLMYFGRVGCLTMLYAFAESHAIVPSKLPLEKVVVG